MRREAANFIGYLLRRGEASDKFWYFAVDR
jgi:hypothetical protein